MVLLEQDGYPDNFATAGYKAFVEAVRTEIAKFSRDHQHDSQPPSPDDVAAEIDAMQKRVHSAVEIAIRHEMGFSGEGWYGTLGRNDDTIGSVAWFVNQDELTAPNRPFRGFAQRWTDEESDGNGDWSISAVFRNLDAPLDTNQCTSLAEQIASLEEELAQTTDEEEKKQIRERIAAIRRQQKFLGCI